MLPRCTRSASGAPTSIHTFEVQLSDVDRRGSHAWAVPGRRARASRVGAMTHPLDPPALPQDVAQQAADDIRRITGVDRHDIALTLGSGWAKAADLIGETTPTPSPPPT